MHIYRSVFIYFFVLVAHNTRVVWAWTWASRSAQTTTPNPHRHAAAERHTVQTHCPPAHGLVSLTCMHAHTHKGHRLNIPFPFRMLCHSIHACIISSLCQVLPIMSSTAQRGSKSLPLPAIPAPCWGQTEVLLLLTTRLLKYSKALGSDCKAAARSLAMFFKVFSNPQACLYFVRLAEWWDQSFKLRFYSTGRRKTAANLYFCSPLWKSHLNTLISQFESFRLFTLWLPPNYDNIIFSAQVVNVHPETSKIGNSLQEIQGLLTKTASSGG